jgi:thiaminase
VPGLGEVLERRIPASELGADGRQLEGFVTLLREQGCLTYPERDSYALHEVKELFQHLAAAWYGRYYGHPLWDRLREGTLSRNGLLSWLLYNYHLSRSAAMSASRSAVHLASPALRTVFAESALEEYSHCEDHFFVRHESLPLSDEDVRRAVHLPASTAFDQQMLRMAEEDWLGHALIGFFQESTARFYDECRKFYAAVDERYGLPGFFRSWEAHVEIDLNESHADDFGRTLDSAEWLSRVDVLHSLGNAWLTFRCLEAGLDEILASDGDDDRVRLRLPVEDGVLDPERTRLLEPYRRLLPDPPARIEARTAAEVYSSLQALGLTSTLPRPVLPPAREDVDFLREDVVRSLFRCLSHSTEHDEILLLGRTVEEAVAATGLSPLERRRLPRSHEAMAVANFLRERATRPVEFVYLLRHLWELQGDPRAGSFTAFLSGQEVEPRAVDRLLTLTLQLNELYEAWVARGPSAEVVDFLRD